MNPEQLRIGVTVWLKSKAETFTITSGYDIDKGIDSDDFKSIELTKAWLRRFGFHNFEYENEMIMYYAGFKFEAIFSNLIKGKLLHLDLNRTTTSIKYVHELQNLLLSLTGINFKP